MIGTALVRPGLALIMQALKHFNASGKFPRSVSVQGQGSCPLVSPCLRKGPALPTPWGSRGRCGLRRNSPNWISIVASSRVPECHWGVARPVGIVTGCGVSGLVSIPRQSGGAPEKGESVGSLRSVWSWCYSQRALGIQEKTQLVLGATVGSG